MNLKIANGGDQCCDVHAMPGVATQMMIEEPKALYTHCYGHALNLATQDCL